MQGLFLEAMNLTLQHALILSLFLFLPFPLPCPTTPPLAEQGKRPFCTEGLQAQAGTHPRKQDQTGLELRQIPHGEQRVRRGDRSLSRERAWDQVFRQGRRIWFMEKECRMIKWTMEKDV